MALAIAAVPAVAGSASWAHHAGSLSSNGAVTVKSLAGGSYAATQNPSGAIAKTNQVAATQPATVIIQATSGGNPECVPVTQAAASAPSCPAGYTAVWQSSGSSCPSRAVFNINGSRFSFSTIDPGGSGSYMYAGFGIDDAPTVLGNPSSATGYSMVPATGTSYTQVCGPRLSTPSSTNWGASLCCK